MNYDKHKDKEDSAGLLLFFCQSIFLQIPHTIEHNSSWESLYNNICPGDFQFLGILSEIAACPAPMESPSKVLFETLYYDSIFGFLMFDQF